MVFHPPVSRALNIADLRAMAKSRLPRGIFDYLDRGVEDEVCMDRNREALRRIALYPKVFRGVEIIDTSVTIFGQKMPVPFAIAPTGGASLFWYDGDVAEAAAGAARNVPYTLSTASTTDLDDIAATGVPLWFQLYMWGNRALSHAVMDRAASLGCKVLFLTADSAVPPNREYTERNGFGTPLRIGVRNTWDILSHPTWSLGVLSRYALNGGIPQQANIPQELRGKVTEAPNKGAMFKNDTIDWGEVKGLRDRWPGKFVIKGMLRPDDAERALALGADGVVVSNHGGRTLDCAAAAIDALPAISAAVGSKMTVLIDGAFSRGTDIVKAIALGADAVLIGRPAVYGLAAGGKDGVIRAIDLLTSELIRTMQQTGSRNISEITRDLIDPGLI